MENAKIQKYKCDILSNFQTMCTCIKAAKKLALLAKINSFVVDWTLYEIVSLEFVGIEAE